jgi:hypothetical protein
MNLNSLISAFSAYRNPTFKKVVSAIHVDPNATIGFVRNEREDVYPN